MRKLILLASFVFATLTMAAINTGCGAGSNDQEDITLAQAQQAEYIFAWTCTGFVEGGDPTRDFYWEFAPTLKEAKAKIVNTCEVWHKQKCRYDCQFDTGRV